jgi:hypothetical protein
MHLAEMEGITVIVAVDNKVFLLYRLLLRAMPRPE